MSVADALGNDGYSLPVGTILAFAGLKVPNKYLLCDGSTISKTRYPELHASLEYLYGGAGDNFLLPDLVNRVILGTAVNANTNAPSGSVATATFNATIAEINMPDIPNTNFNVSLGTNPTYTATLGNAGQGVAVGTASQTTVDTTSAAGISCFASNGSPLNTGVTVGFNSMGLAHTGAGTPISTALADITVLPKSYNMLYIIKAEY